MLRSQKSACAICLCLITVFIVPLHGDIDSALLWTVGGVSESTRSNNEAQQRFEGRISVQGNEPHTYLALATESEVFALTGPLVDRLMRHQGQQVVLEGSTEGASRGRPPELYVEAIVEAGPEALPPPGNKKF